MPGGWAGNGSLSEWIADQVGPEGVAIATDIDPDLPKDASGSHLEIRAFDVVTGEPTDGPYDLVLGRAILDHLPQRREVVARMARWVPPRVARAQDPVRSPWSEACTA